MHRNLYVYIFGQIERFKVSDRPNSFLLSMSTATSVSEDMTEKQNFPSRASRQR